MSAAPQRSPRALASRATGDPHKDLRIRAAWLYYIEGLTQSDVAEALGVNRIMITRLLSDAKRRGDVVIRIRSQITPLLELQEALQRRFGLERVIIAPVDGPGGDPTRAIAAAAGAFVTDLMEDGLTVGVGWGRTLHRMLPYIDGRALDGVRVVSLLGGIAQARRFNPAEFAWQFAELFEAEGYLIPAPAIVDSPTTKHALLEHCGLDQILQLARSCEVALLSCGGTSNMTTSYRSGHVSEAERRSLVEAGAVGDLLYNFLDAEGRVLDHPINQRAISMPLDALRRIPRKVLISGGLEKLTVIRATLKALEPGVFITDETTARALLGEDGQ